jgi:hypothetical protein
LTLLATAGLVAALPSLHDRWTDEASKHRVILLVDWKEVSQLADRDIPSPLYLLQALHNAGIQGVLYSPLTLKDVARGGLNSLNDRTITIEKSALAAQVMHELSQRGVRGIEGERTETGYSLTRASGDFSSLSDIEVGYDAHLLALGQDQNLDSYLRVNQDPWLSVPDALPNSISGVIFTTDDPPGGVEALPDWSALLNSRSLRQLWVEFKPTHAATALAQAVPSTVLRTHTIPTAELKDLSASQELSRWQRAVHERSCHCLLFRPAPYESWNDFLLRLDTLRRSLIRDGWELALPPVHTGWMSSSHRKLLMYLGMAFGVAAFAPLVGLWWAGPYAGWRAFIGVTLFALAGGAIAASLASLPETRLELIPFRGIKAALIIPWLGAILVLYPWEELRKKLTLPLTRLDLLVGILLVGVLGYGIVRSGNAAPAWRASSEQGVRDYLEKSLNVRPRFKEFAVGYPLLLLGFLLKRRSSRGTSGKHGARTALDVRPLIWIGMIGPVSTVNTFCHLHSPLALAVARSSLGIFLGCLGGLVLYGFYEWGNRKL